jgi:septum site-determining protein MinC
MNDNDSIVTAKGTADGLVLRIDSRVDQNGILSGVRNFIESRKKFLFGNEVALEWVGGEPEAGVEPQLRAILCDEFNMKIRQGGLHSELEFETTSVEDFLPVEENMFAKLDNYDEANAKVLVTTLRSGQKIESEHSIVIFGDVNSGAEVVSGGDVIILGTLRGVAHAGAYDETGGGRVIVAITFQPTQLRIGSTISRGDGKPHKSSGVPELARIDGASIVVEPYSVKTMTGLVRGLA